MVFRLPTNSISDFLGRLYPANPTISFFNWLDLLSFSIFGSCWACHSTLPLKINMKSAFTLVVPSLQLLLLACLRAHAPQLVRSRVTWPSSRLFYSWGVLPTLTTLVPYNPSAFFSPLRLWCPPIHQLSCLGIVFNYPRVRSVSNLLLHLNWLLLFRLRHWLSPCHCWLMLKLIFFIAPPI